MSHGQRELKVAGEGPKWAVCAAGKTTSDDETGPVHGKVRAPC